ncbi:MAG: flavodoxin family protein [Candidatus Omnitrophica bacterium]|nr:flavodoxin family protein [Candidatus Omnitrophota bacterium]
MKVVAFNGSPRKDGNCTLLIKKVFEELEDNGIKTELIHLAGSKIHGCRACYGCFQKKNKQCCFQDDEVNSWISKMVEADGIILASPTYFADVTPEMKALIDRAGFVCRANGNLLVRKTGAAIVSVRRAGEIHALDTLNHFFLCQSMFLVGSSYWNIGVGREKGEVEKDEEGLKTMRMLGQNLAWLLKRLSGCYQ